MLHQKMPCMCLMLMLRFSYGTSVKQSTMQFEEFVPLNAMGFGWYFILQTKMPPVIFIASALKCLLQTCSTCL